MKAKLAIVLAILVSVSLVQATHFPGHTCAISTGHGLLQDYDCDDVPDQVDNCPYTPNQRQVDQNSDGIGDKCAAMYGYPETREPRHDRQHRHTNEAQTDIEVEEIQDLFAGGPGAVYNIKITNNGQEDQRYELTVTGVQFGTFRFDPGNVIIVESGETETAYLNAIAYEDKQGEYTFTLHITSGGDTETTTLTANVLREEPGTDWERMAEIVAYVLLGIVALLLLLMLIGRLRKWADVKETKRGRKDEEIYSYY